MTDLDDANEKLVAAQEGVRRAQAELHKAHREVQDALAQVQRRCRVCGSTDEYNEESGYGPLVDIQVIVANGEEGFAEPIRYFCWKHAEKVLDDLITLGFAVHRHGGANFLEPHDCPGYSVMDKCPAPVIADEDGNRWD